MFRFRDPPKQEYDLVPKRLDDTPSKMSWILPSAGNSQTIHQMKIGWVRKDGEVIDLPSLTAVIQKEEGWYVSTCPELGVASQGKTRKEAYAMLAEAAELWLEAASAKEIKRRLKLGGTVRPLELAHA